VRFGEHEDGCLLGSSATWSGCSPDWIDLPVVLTHFLPHRCFIWQCPGVPAFSALPFRGYLPLLSPFWLVRHNLRSTMLPFRRAVDRPPGTFTLCAIHLQKPRTMQPILEFPFEKNSLIICSSKYFFSPVFLLHIYPAVLGSAVAH
jgi:hypothetical protein